MLVFSHQAPGLDIMRNNALPWAPMAVCSEGQGELGSVQGDRSSPSAGLCMRALHASRKGRHLPHFPSPVAEPSAAQTKAVSCMHPANLGSAIERHSPGKGSQATPAAARGHISEPDVMGTVL